jgi:hypothetical protein
VVVWRQARARGPLGQGVEWAPAAERLRSVERACVREVAAPPPFYWCSSTLVRRPGAKGGTDRRRWLARRAARYDVSGDAARGGY